VQARQLKGTAMFLHQPARARIVERVDDESAVLQESAGRTVAEFLADGVDLDASRAKQALTEHLHLPAPDVRFAIELCADVVFLDPVAVDDAQLPKALAREVVGQVRPERADAADRDGLIS
jgi:hypothetical protein